MRSAPSPRSIPSSSWAASAAKRARASWAPVFTRPIVSGARDTMAPLWEDPPLPRGPTPMELIRQSGVLLHPTQLPGRFGRGDLGPAAHAFVKELAAAG